MKDFKSWLKQELSKPSGYDHYDPNGNSYRAIAIRGYWREVLWQYANFPNLIKAIFYGFEGFETPVIWFFQIAVVLALFPIMPFVIAYYHHKTAINAYRRDYERAGGEA
jgi:hypothetical protein